ncbi:reverse transcriptase domain-containing protein [Tanacetum coccineum]
MTIMEDTIMEYLKDGTLPDDRKEASKLRIKARQYELLEWVLYRRSFLKPWLMCVGPLQADYVIREIHEGSCSMHARPRSVMAKAMWLGYYWPTMHRNARDMIRKFAMDYFTKWIEAKAVATINGSQVKEFVWDNIVCCFGLSGEIVSDNGKQFSDNPFKDWCEKLNITQRFASVKHLQSNGLVERERSLGEGIKARLGEGNKNWIEELSHVLWAHRTMIKSSHDDTPFSLTYGTKAVIPVEVGMPTYRTVVVDVVHNDEELRLNLDLMEERRECVAIREAKAKLKMTKYYNAKVRGVTFRLRDFVYRSNDASHAVDGEKLGPKWEGPYEVTEALRDEAYRLRSMDVTVLPRTWNIANLKKLEGMFLGYMISPKGIKPCPDKTEVVLRLPSPWIIKEKCIKKSNFHWTPEVEQAFNQLKQHLSELPMLGPELNYTPIEKLVLALVFAAKRLRRYFQAHPIAVITDQPIKQIISRPDVAGRLQKWSVMLGEHNITYQPRKSMKGQILVDFLVEKLDEALPDTSVDEPPARAMDTVHGWIIMCRRIRCWPNTDKPGWNGVYLRAKVLVHSF